MRSRFARLSLRIGRSRATVALTAAVATFALAGGAALATIPGGDGKIHTCYQKSGGAIRVIDDSVTNCKSGETSLAWDVTGPQGPQGEQGPQGPQGEQGPQGPPGTIVGDTVFAQSEELDACSDHVVLQQTVSVASDSRIYVDGYGIYDDDAGENNLQLDLWVQLRDAADTQTLGTTPNTRVLQLAGTETPQVGASGILRSGPGPFAITADPFVAVPGDYLLQLVVKAAGACDGTPNFRSSSLTHMLIGA